MQWFSTCGTSTPWGQNAFFNLTQAAPAREFSHKSTPIYPHTSIYIDEFMRVRLLAFAVA